MSWFRVRDNHQSVAFGFCRSFIECQCQTVEIYMRERDAVIRLNISTTVDLNLGVSDSVLHLLPRWRGWRWSGRPSSSERSLCPRLGRSASPSGAKEFHKETCERLLQSSITEKVSSDETWWSVSPFCSSWRWRLRMFPSCFSSAYLLEKSL